MKKEERKALLLTVLFVIVFFAFCVWFEVRMGDSIGQACIQLFGPIFFLSLVGISLKILMSIKSRRAGSRKSIEPRERLRIEIRETVDEKKEAKQRVAELEAQEARLRVQYAKETGETDAYRNGADAVPADELKRLKA